MPEIGVNFESLQAGQDAINRTCGNLIATLDQLESDLQPMLQSWTGDAQSAYLDCKKNWDNGAQALAEVLGNIGQAVGQAHDNYHSANNTARNNWT